MTRWYDDPLILFAVLLFVTVNGVFLLAGVLAWLSEKFPHPFGL